MANKLKTTYRNFKILYESYNVEKGIYVITISYWQDVPDDYDNYNKFKKKILHDKWLDSNSLFFPLVLKIAQEETKPVTKLVRKKKQQRFLTDFQITLQLRTPVVVRFDKQYTSTLQGKVNCIRTFKTNTQIVQSQIEKWLDMMFALDCAPKPYLNKKGAT